MKLRIGPPVRTSRLARAGWAAAGGQALLVLLLCFGCGALPKEQLALATALQISISAVLAVCLRTLGAHETSLRTARARELRTERLAEIATLSAGAAHELSTPLSTIAIAASEMALSGHAAVTEDARLIREQVERCKELLRQMADDGSDGPRAMNVGELVRTAVARLPEPDRVQVEWKCASDATVELLIPVRATARALRNVLKNALDASPPEASVGLCVGRTRAGDFVFDVRDAGAGMSADVLGRVTEPFFSTKSAGNGMGLGLYLTASVVDLLGGHLEIESAPGRGTRVLCTLPASAGVP